MRKKHLEKVEFNLPTCLSMNKKETVTLNCQLFKKRKKNPWQSKMEEVQEASFATLHLSLSYQSLIGKK